METPTTPEKEITDPPEKTKDFEERWMKAYLESALGETQNPWDEILAMPSRINSMLQEAPWEEIEEQLAKAAAVLKKFARDGHPGLYNLRKMMGLDNPVPAQQ